MSKMSQQDERVAQASRRHWRRSVALMAVLLLLWAVAGLGCGILFAEHLNQWKLGGFRLGFWFAQQGSIIVFVLLILIFALAMNRIDARYKREIRGSEGEDA